MKNDDDVRKKEEVSADVNQKTKVTDGEEKEKEDVSKDLKEIRRELNARYEERVYGGKNEKRGEYDEMWKEIDKLILVIKENEEDWTKGSREEKAQVRKREKEERLKRVAEKKKKYGKLGKESKGEKRESEENVRRKIAMIEIRKNLWRSYQVGRKIIK